MPALRAGCADADGRSRVGPEHALLHEEKRVIYHSATDEEAVTAFEMLARGFGFLGVSLLESEALRFVVKDGKVMLPYRAIPGVGDTAAFNLKEAMAEGQILSVDDLCAKAKLNKTVVAALKNMGVLGDLPESNQMTLF